VSTTEVNQQPVVTAGTGALPENPDVTTDSASPEPRRSPWRRWLGALAPALLYLGIRELGILVLSWLAASNGTTATEALTSWDGKWYLGCELLRPLSSGELEDFLA